MGTSERSEPRVYPAPAQVVFDALIAGARQVGLVVTGADPQQGVVWADKQMTLMSWGEVITMYVRPEGPQQTSVVVESRLKFGLVAWGAHKKNFELVHRALDIGLANTGHAPQHAQQFGGQHGQSYGRPQQHGAPHSQPPGFPQQGQQQGHQQQGGYQQGGYQQGPASQPHGFPQQGGQGHPQQQGHQQGW